MAECLGTKRFSNRDYSIRITFYAHGMAEAHYDDKKIRRRRGHVCYGLLIFDSCTGESIDDFMRSLRELQASKVARRWFRRQLRHCTDGLMGPDGRPDYVKVCERDDMLGHISENILPGVEGRGHCFLSGSGLGALLDACPEAGCNGRPGLRVHIRPEGQPAVDAPVCWPGGECLRLPNGEILSIIRRVLPDFYETVRRDRELGNCTAGIDLEWASSRECDIHAIVQDNDYVDYVIRKHNLK